MRQICGGCAPGGKFLVALSVFYVSRALYRRPINYPIHRGAVIMTSPVFLRFSKVAPYMPPIRRGGISRRIDHNLPLFPPIAYKDREWLRQGRDAPISACRRYDNTYMEL